MKAYELVRVVINKKLVPEQEGRGRRGYGNLLRVRLLVYGMLKGIHRDKGLIRHLKENPEVRYGLGFYDGIPDRSRLSRWKKEYTELLERVFEALRDLVSGREVELLLVDSTPLEDPRDPEARAGFYSRGCFKGFKVHLSINEKGLPMKALLTPGNKHDSQFLEELLVKARKVLGDAGYDSQANRELCRKKGSEAVIARNPRRTGRKFKTPELLKRKRYLVEQFNSILKECMQGCWKLVKGIRRKGSVVYAALIAILLNSLIHGRREISRYWC